MNDDFFAEFDAMFADLARKARPGGFEPNADVYLSADAGTMLVNVEIAGAEPAELRVMVEERRLYIVGRRYDRERAERGSVLMKEIEYGDFVKKIHLPVPVAYDDATASYRDGILTIRLPVTEESRLPTRRTEIRMTVRRVPA
jgi:HSP20 family protein